jgi:hypothetical protein
MTGTASVAIHAAEMMLLTGVTATGTQLSALWHFIHQNKVESEMHLPLGHSALLQCS